VTRAYAERTTVSTDRSRGEIESTLRRYGADQFVSGWDASRAMLGFRVNGRHVRFELPMPDRSSDEIRLTPSGAYERTAKQQDEVFEAEVRRRWRALNLAVKAKLEAVQTGIASFDDEFLAYLVLPGNQTVGQLMADGRLDAAIASGAIPMLLPDGLGRRR
jgi:hypothetical protein